MTHIYIRQTYFLYFCYKNYKNCYIFVIKIVTLKLKLILVVIQNYKCLSSHTYEHLAELCKKLYFVSPNNNYLKVNIRF